MNRLNFFLQSNETFSVAIQVLLRDHWRHKSFDIKLVKLFNVRVALINGLWDEHAERFRIQFELNGADPFTASITFL